MRYLALSIALLAGCSAIGYHRLPGPTADVPDDAPRAVLVVVDGLRSDVLADYLRTLRDTDQEPAWPSGLAFLSREGLRIASASWAEAPLPGYGLAADAALITGQYPDATGIPGTVFYEARADGSLRRFDFSEGPDGAQIYFQPEFKLPDADNRPLLETLVRAPTIYERLAPGPSVAVLHVLGRGAEWLVPQRSADGVNAILQHEISAWVVPRFDRGVRNAAIDVLLRGDHPRLISLYFRGVSAGSCFQAERACRVDQPDLREVQTEQLKRVDGHLERVFKVLRGSHPEALSRTLVVLTGTGGLDERTLQGQPDGHRLLGPVEVLERLAAGVDGACSVWLNAALTSGDVAVAPNGAQAHVYLRRFPAGQDPDRAAHLDCLGSAIQAALAVPAEGGAKADPWLGGAAWTPGRALGSAKPRGAEVEIALAPMLVSALSNSRESRIRARLTRAFDDGEVTRAGDALLIAASPWIFVDPSLPRPPAHAGSGGLEDAGAETAFLMAGSRLDDQVLRGLSTTAVDLADIAPTLLSVLKTPPERLVGLPRPSLLAWQGAELTWVAADRQILPPPAPNASRMVWQETPESVTVGIEEAVALWPPDRLGLKFGVARYDWNPETGAFPEGSPCTFAEADGRRRWQCVVPVDRSQPGLSIGSAQRTPAGEEGEKTKDFSAFVVPVVLGPSHLPEITSVNVRCADALGVHLDLTAHDKVGLDRLEIVLATRHDGGSPGRSPASLTAVTPLGGLKVHEACQSDPLGSECAVAAVQTGWAGPVVVAFQRRWVDHEREATRLLSGANDGLAELVERFGATPAQEPPRTAFLLARLCNVAGHCTDRPLLSDRDYLELAEAGCGLAEAP